MRGAAARGTSGSVRARTVSLFALLPALAACPGPAAPPPRPAEGGPRPRVVTAAPALAELVVAIGAEPHLAGVSRYCTHPPSLTKLPQIGGAIDPNLEAIDALRPDVVLMQAKDERLDELAARRGFEVAAFRVETIAQVRSAALALGERLGKQAGARAFVDGLDRALDAARAARPARPVRTLVVFGHRPGDLTQVSAPGGATFITECLEAAGGASCLADLPGDAWHVVSPEAVLARAPELIVELHPDPVDEATAKALRADWAPLDVPAVREGKVAIVQGSEVLIPGPRLVQLVAKLGRAVRGELDVADGPPR